MEDGRSKVRQALKESTDVVRTLLNASKEEFSVQAFETWSDLRRKAHQAIRKGVGSPEDIDAFWSFVVKLSTLNSKVRNQQILEVVASAAETEIWGMRFWLSSGKQLEVWNLPNPSKPDSSKLAETTAAALMRYSPREDLRATWIANAPEEFRTNVQSKFDAMFVRRGTAPAMAFGGPNWHGKPSAPSHASPILPDPPWSQGHTGSVDDASWEVAVEEQAALKADSTPRGVLRSDSTISLPRVSSIRPSIADMPEELERLRAEKHELEVRLAAACRQRDMLAEKANLRSSTRPAYNAGVALPGTFAIAACKFETLGGTELPIPGDGTLLAVQAGESLEILGRHPSGWVRVRRALHFDRVQSGTGSIAHEGWILDTVIQAAGEIGRGIATCKVDPPNGTEDKQLEVAEGTLLKLLAREGSWWLVELEGCRGFVPLTAVRQAREDELDGVLSSVPSLCRAQSKLALHDAKLRGDEEAPKRPKVNKAEDQSPQQRQWTFGLWAYLGSYPALSLCIMIGICGIFYRFRREQNLPPPLQEYRRSIRFLIVPIYSVALGLLWLAYMLKASWSASSDDKYPRIPIRGLAILFLSAPLFSTGVTLLPGFATAFIGFLYVISVARQEKGKTPDSVYRRSPAAWMRKEMDGDLQGMSRLSPRFWAKWWELQGLRGEQRKWYLILIWLAANAFLLVTRYLFQVQALNNPSKELLEAITTRCWTGSEQHKDCGTLLDAYRFWIPIAKMFGQGLNLNCALIVMPVCQHFLRKVNSLAIQDKGASGAACRVVPTHKNLVFHKGLAGVIAIMAWAHTFAHYMAYSFTLTTFSRFGFSNTTITISIWATGAIILLCIVAMYPVSREYVKRTYFELFYYTHVSCATIFMVCLFWHGPVFYYWAAFPVGLYLVDRYFRWEVSQLAPAKLLQIIWRPPVMQLIFEAPWHYHAGQYVWLCCPRLGRFEKHPFTISSAPETELLSLAIKCWPGGWTERLRDFLAATCEISNGKSQGWGHVFEEVDWLSGMKRRGLSKLEDGTPLLQIDGPHAAPAMLYVEFEVVLLAAAGIGLTPASSILRSLLQHRWRSSQASRPHCIYFAWLCAHPEVPAFEWFAEELSDSEVAASANVVSEDGPERHCELHLFVTRAPPADDAKATKAPKSRPTLLHGEFDGKLSKRPYTSTQLLEWMQHPATKSSDMSSILKMPPENRPNQSGHTLMWNGRVDWTALFEHVVQRHQASHTEVGVFFCGAPGIGKDLKKSCHAHSGKNVRFNLLKESF